MTMTKNVLTSRIHVCRGVAVAALALFWLTASHAQISPLSRTTAAGHTFTGGSPSFTVGNLSASPQPPTTTWQVPPGATASVGKFGMGASGSNPSATSRANFPIPGGAGRTVPLDVANTLSKPSAAKAIAKFAAKGLPIAGTLAAAYTLMQDLGYLARDKDGDGVTEWYKRKDNCTSAGACYEYNLNHAGTGNGSVWSSSRTSLASTAKTYLENQCAANFPTTGCPNSYTYVLISADQPTPAGSVRFDAVRKTDGVVFAGTPITFGSRQKAAEDSEVQVGESELEMKIAGQSGWPTKSSQALADALNYPGPTGAPGWNESVEVTATTVSTPQPNTAGATSTKSEPASKPGPNGTTVTGTKVTTTTTNYTTNTTNNTFQITNNVTHTSVTNWSDGTTTTDTTTEGTPVEKPEEQEDPCKANPDRVGCQTLEEPTGEEIPKTTKELTYAPESIGGGGSCPPDIVKVLGGHSVTVFSYAPGCALITQYMKPIVMMLSALIAFMILVPGARGQA